MPLKLPKRVLLTMLFTIALSSPPAPAQGCAQCRDNTAATPPSTQAAYRHAILMMVFTAGSLFLTTLILFKRQR